MIQENEHKRADRVGQLIKQELSMLLLDGVKDPRIGFVTVTEVKLTDDLKSAIVYISSLGNKTQEEESLVGLESAVGYLRKVIGQRLQLRYTPKLMFKSDQSLREAHRIEQLIAAIEDGEQDLPERHSDDEYVEAQTLRTRMQPMVDASKEPVKRSGRKGRKGRRK
jgi:ribosome-binding factor A